MFKKILLILGLVGFNYCFGVYESKDIILAIENNDISYFEKAVQDETFDPNQELEKNSGYTALFATIYYEKKEIFDLLLQNKNKCKKIDVNLKILNKDENGDSFLLLYACLSHQKYFVQQLLNHKDIDINKVNNKGWTALLFALLMEENHDLVPFFLNHDDIDLSIKYKDRTMYEFASVAGYTSIANAILKKQIIIENEKKQPQKQEKLIVIDEK